MLVAQELIKITSGSDVYNRSLTMHATQIRGREWTTYLRPLVAVKGFNQRNEKASKYEF